MRTTEVARLWTRNTLVCKLGAERVIWIQNTWWRRSHFVSIIQGYSYAYRCCRPSWRCRVVEGRLHKSVYSALCYAGTISVHLKIDQQIYWKNPSVYILLSLLNSAKKDVLDLCVFKFINVIKNEMNIFITMLHPIKHFST